MSALQKQRSEWLSRLGTSAADGAALTRQLNEWLEQSSPVIDSHREDHRSGAIETARHRWTADYFERQKIFAEANFSDERVRHLIEVREHLRATCVRGFVPSPLKAGTSDSTGVVDRSLENASAPFTPTASLERVFDEGDALQIRAMLALELADRRLDDVYLSQSLDFAEERIPGLCEPYREDRFALATGADPWNWTAEYFDRQSTFLELNFSQKRFLHLIQVRGHLRQQGIQGFAPDATLPKMAESACCPSNDASVTGSSTSPSSERGDSLFMKIGILVAAIFAGLIAVMLSRKE
jgi:hypothetical protein